MPRYFLGISALYLDSLFIEEMQVGERLAVVAVLNRVYILDHIDFADRLAVNTSQYSLELPKSCVFVNLHHAWILAADLISSDAVLDLETQYVSLNG